MLKKKSIVKNYIILIVLFILSFAFTLYLCKWYNVYKEYKNEIPVIRGVLSEISYDELDHYIIDNSNIMLYICTSNSDNCRGFEKKLKKYVNLKELSDKIVYLNITNVDQEVFLTDFNTKYNLKNKLTSNYPAFILFRDGKYVSLLQDNSKKTLTISKLDNFIELNDYLSEGE